MNQCSLTGVCGPGVRRRPYVDSSPPPTRPSRAFAAPPRPAASPKLASQNRLWMLGPAVREPCAVPAQPCAPCGPRCPPGPANPCGRTSQATPDQQVQRRARDASACPSLRPPQRSAQSPCLSWTLSSSFRRPRRAQKRAATGRQTGGHHYRGRTLPTAERNTTTAHAFFGNIVRFVISPHATAASARESLSQSHRAVTAPAPRRRIQAPAIAPSQPASTPLPWVTRTFEVHARTITLPQLPITNPLRRRISAKPPPAAPAPGQLVQKPPSHRRGLSTSEACLPATAQSSRK